MRGSVVIHDSQWDAGLIENPSRCMHRLVRHGPGSRIERDCHDNPFPAAMSMRRALGFDAPLRQRPNDIVRQDQRNQAPRISLVAHSIDALDQRLLLGCGIAFTHNETGCRTYVVLRLRIYLPVNAGDFFHAAVALLSATIFVPSREKLTFQALILMVLIVFIGQSQG
jgi:hypothetical protein